MLQPRARAKGLELIFEADIRLPENLSGDSAHLTQILLNLIQNAIKFTDAGSVSLQVRDLAREGQSVRIRFSVKDTGIGIPESARARVFQPFEQVDSGRDRRFGGSGLGASIARNLAELLGGTIDFEPNPGGGTHFWLDLPLRLAEARVKEIAEAVPSAGQAATVSTPPEKQLSEKVIEFDDPFRRHRRKVRSLHVIVADDQQANRTVLQKLLERAGHRVSIASDGELALDCLEEHKPDLMIVDLHMPGLSGLDVIRQARVMQAGRKHTPIVVLSADALVETREEAMRAGAFDYLTKPVSVSVLLEMLAQVAESAASKTDRRAAPQAGASEAWQPHSRDVELSNGVLQELAGMGLGEAFLREFVDQCLGDISRSMTLARQACTNGDLALLREQAHAIKGVAENLGATALVKRCQEIMKNDPATLSARMPQLARDLEALVEQTAHGTRATLNGMLASVPATGAHGGGRSDAAGEPEG